MTTEAKFRAAVNVIKSLPKNGSYQPSYSMQLRFYSFYKQATEGTCHQSKPAFWDIVGKAKWDAWHKLGSMPKEEAMNRYVDELKQIIETMSYTDKVADFMDILGPFYEISEVHEMAAKFGMTLPNPNDPSFKIPDIHDLGLENLRGQGFTEEEAANQIAALAEKVDKKLKHGSKTDEVDDQWLGDSHVMNGHAVIMDKDSRSRLEEESMASLTLPRSTEEYLSMTDSDDEEFSDPIDMVSEDVTITKKVTKMPDQDSGFTEEQTVPESSILVQDQNDRDQLWAFFPSGTGYSNANGFAESNGNDERAFENGYHENVTIAAYNLSPRWHSDNNNNNRSNGSVQGRSRSDVKGMVARGGEDERGARGIASSGTSGSRQAADNSGRGQRDSLNQADSGHYMGRDFPVGAAAGMGGGGRGGGGRSIYPPPNVDITEQIAMALLRLQRDMDSVLARLNMLETVALAQHNNARERMVATVGAHNNEVHSVGSKGWWPFKELSCKTFLFFVTWPIILQLILKLLAHRRARCRLGFSLVRRQTSEDSDDDVNVLQTALTLLSLGYAYIFNSY